ncbi:MAG: hypothetical protein ACXVRV_08640 [Gaiellaceae bacterium]
MTTAAHRRMMALRRGEMGSGKRILLLAGKRILLLAVAGLLSASALLATGILLAGRFGETEGRILTTTALLAGYGLVALPSTMLLDQGRSARLALGALVLAAVSASLTLASVWTGNPPTALGKAVGTATVLALASAQVSALVARQSARDPVWVRRLFAVSCALAAAVAAMVTTLIWVQIDGGSYARLLASLAVLDLLAVALQPILARVRPVGAPHALRIVVEPGKTLLLNVEAPDLATAAAKAIRRLERDGHRILSLEFGGRTAGCRTDALNPERRASRPVPSATRASQA